MPRYTEIQRLEHKIIRKFQKALYQYKLIDDGDKILIGLSGGKDSLCLMELLAKRAKIQKPTFSVEAVHVKMENIHYESDTAYLYYFAKKLGVPLHVVTTSFEYKPECKKSPCFLCSWYRRKQLFNLAQNIGCNKIALGHHMDDIIHTALMNLSFNGHFSTMPIKLKMSKMPLTIIRPMCLISESDIHKYAELTGYKKQLKKCPYETETERNNAKHIFKEFEAINPEIRYSIWNALEIDNKLIE